LFAPSKAAVCSDCPTTHAIQRTDLTTTQLAITRNCGACHKENFKSYTDTYHGQVSTLGYGYTEPQAAFDDAHHRQVGRLALGAAPVDWFAASLRFDERYDLHPDDGRGEDDGWVFDPRLGARPGLRHGDVRGAGPDREAAGLRPQASSQ
jgi:hypothetical protein